MNYRKIISVINEHTTSTVIARYAIQLAAACKAELVLYAVHDGSDKDTLTTSHQEHLALVATKLDVPVTRISEAGDMRTLLPLRVQAEQADLVLYPLTPYKRYGTDLQRRTIHALLRTVGSDLAIMRVVGMSRPHHGHILVPLGTVTSDRERRLIFITALATSLHSAVTLFHLPAQQDDTGVSDVLALFRQQLQRQNVAVTVRSGCGEVGRAITLEAVTRNYDLIVLGVSRRGILRKLFFGNPAGDVMHQPPCNSILFRSAL
jgi:nucleotide-binding universal stress UspA family protein